MRVEVLHFDGCPSYEALMRRLRELMGEVGVRVPVEVRVVESAEEAERARFLGSPTLRIDGRDVDPAASERTDFGLKCRLYAGTDGLQASVPDDLVRAALTSARDTPTGMAANPTRSAGLGEVVRSRRTRDT